METLENFRAHAQYANPGVYPAHQGVAICTENKVTPMAAPAPRQPCCWRRGTRPAGCLIQCPMRLSWQLPRRPATLRGLPARRGGVQPPGCLCQSSLAAEVHRSRKANTRGFEPARWQRPTGCRWGDRIDQAPPSSAAGHAACGACGPWSCPLSSKTTTVSARRARSTRCASDIRSRSSPR